MKFDILMPMMMCRSIKTPASVCREATRQRGGETASAIDIAAVQGLKKWNPGSVVLHCRQIGMAFKIYC
jgi:hypothetical protein